MEKAAVELEMGEEEIADNVVADKVIIDTSIEQVEAAKQSSVVVEEKDFNNKVEMP